MNTLRLQYNKVNMEKAMIMVGMTLMEMTGLVLLVCGLFNIRIF